MAIDWEKDLQRPDLLQNDHICAQFTIYFYLFLNGVHSSLLIQQISKNFHYIHLYKCLFLILI